MGERGYARLSEQFFKILPCIPSGPLALLELILERYLCTLKHIKALPLYVFALYFSNYQILDSLKNQYECYSLMDQKIVHKNNC